MAFRKTQSSDTSTSLTSLRRMIYQYHHADELSYVESLLAQLDWTQELSSQAESLNRRLIAAMRSHDKDISFLTDFLNQYGLSSKEGVVLMCLSEALLRVPDVLTANLLIKDKLDQFSPSERLASSGNLILSSSAFALKFLKHFLSFDPDRKLQNKDIENVQTSFWHILSRIIVRLGEAPVRAALGQSVRILSDQFIFAEEIEEALDVSKAWSFHGYLFSYDMLGESARTYLSAQAYADRYSQAIQLLARQQTVVQESLLSPGISVKLSAIVPYFGEAQKEGVMAFAMPILKGICIQAAEAGLMITLDAEEAKCLDLTLDIFEALIQDPELANWNGLGIAVQAYQKRASAVIDWLICLAQTHHKRIPIRLVKGAYWDSEIKQGQTEGVEDYAVLTKKPYTDLHYLLCAQKLFHGMDWVYPQFATHNAATLSAILAMANGRTDFEFQKLFGMGDELYIEAIRNQILPVKCRIYAPVGHYKELLPYLVRRLLENGSNTSFLPKVFDKDVAIDSLVKDPVEKVTHILKRSQEEHKRIVKPGQIFEPERLNSKGVDIYNRYDFECLSKEVAAHIPRVRAITSLVQGQKSPQGEERDLYSPIRRNLRLGSVVEAPSYVAEQAMRVAQEGFLLWTHTSASQRAACLEKAAEMLEKNMPKMVSILIHEGGKTYADAVAEVREAIDFCRYYATHGRQLFDRPLHLTSPTGESNTHALAGRGVFVAISPWNFPLAIFTGQVVAALMAGNTVVAKPSGQTPIIAFEMVKLLHAAGIPVDALQLLLGKASVLGSALLESSLLSGVVFTGSDQTAHSIQKTLAQRAGPILPFIAETGGINAMIVDSSALIEHVIDDVLTSAFRSAGQRCSALRLVYVQEDIADSFINMLKGAMDTLIIGDPCYLKTDVGPVIDSSALVQLEAYTRLLNEKATLIGKTPLPSDIPDGFYIQPQAYEVDRPKDVDREIFGPILHVVRYKAQDLNKVVRSINDKGYGLTLGIQSRIQSTIDFIVKRARVGNIYVNRNMIGAVVGVQPFGGEGMSGTGPKAGGIYYLLRFATERVVTVNTTASGGDINLLTSDPDW